MNYRYHFFFMFALLLPCLVMFSNASEAKKGVAQYVNPFIGTGGHGHTFPGVTYPFGACQLSPDTRLQGWDGCGGYHYSDSIIYGFSHTHLSGTGCSDYGDILLMPVSKTMRLDKYQYASAFSHAHEKAGAGYYQVFLKEPNVNAELLPVLHGGVHKYAFGLGSEMNVVLDLKHRDELLDSHIEQVDDHTIRGYRFSKAWAAKQKVFFEITFSEKIVNILYEPKPGGSITTPQVLSKSYQVLIQFAPTPPVQSAIEPILMVKCAISGVDEEGAHKNLLAEMPHWDFEKYRDNAVAAWERELSKIEVKKYGDQQLSMPGDQQKKINDEKVIFYTALYHTMIHPSLYSDVDGRYRGRDDKIHNTGGKFDYYTVFSLWDTYRALHPLLTIIDRKRTNDFINTFIKQYEQAGRLPVWELSSNETNCMIGYHVVSVIWDAYNKGIRDYDVNKAYEAMKSIATHFTDYEGEGLDMKLKEDAGTAAADADALESYNKFGYVRADDSHESVSKTLEYAYNDWCIAQMAEALGYKEDQVYYSARSRNWMNVYDPTTGFMRARKNGCLYEPFSPYTVDNNYTEANAWQYSFYVPHDLELLMNLSGKNRKNFEDKLDALFAAKEKTEGREQADITGLIGQYAHGNEPSHHIAFLYDFYNEGSNRSKNKTDELTDRIANEFYMNSPDGLIGNEDCGQMSAWYVFKAMGFYPLCPGKNSFYTCRPVFDEILLNGKSLVKNDRTADYSVRKLMLYDSLQVDGHAHAIVVPPSDKRPQSFNYQSAVPFIVNATRTFKDSMKISIATISGQQVYYTLNDNDDFVEYLEPIAIRNNTEIRFGVASGASTRAGSRKNAVLIDKVQIAEFTKLPADRTIILHNTYHPSYSAGGAQALMDGIMGKLNWRAGDWQGYQGQDIEVVMAFDDPREIRRISANFLEDQNSWIFYPKEIVYYVSNDSLNWIHLETIPTRKSAHSERTGTSSFPSSVKPRKEKYRFVKMLAKNFGPMPDWHEGRGNPTFIFIDELEVKTEADK